MAKFFTSSEAAFINALKGAQSNPAVLSSLISKPGFTTLLQEICTKCAGNGSAESREALALIGAMAPSTGFDVAAFIADNPSLQVAEDILKNRTPLYQEMKSWAASTADAVVTSLSDALADNIGHSWGEIAKQDSFEKMGQTFCAEMMLMPFNTLNAFCAHLEAKIGANAKNGNAGGAKTGNAGGSTPPATNPALQKALDTARDMQTFQTEFENTLRRDGNSALADRFHNACNNPDVKKLEDLKRFHSSLYNDVLTSEQGYLDGPNKNSALYDVLMVKDNLLTMSQQEQFHEDFTTKIVDIRHLNDLDKPQEFGVGYGKQETGDNLKKTMEAAGINTDHTPFKDILEAYAQDPSDPDRQAALDMWSEHIMTDTSLAGKSVQHQLMRLKTEIEKTSQHTVPTLRGRSLQLPNVNNFVVTFAPRSALGSKMETAFAKDGLLPAGASPHPLLKQLAEAYDARTPDEHNRLLTQLKANIKTPQDVEIIQKAADAWAQHHPSDIAIPTTISSDMKFFTLPEANQTTTRSEKIDANAPTPPPPTPTAAPKVVTPDEALRHVGSIPAAITALQRQMLTKNAGTPPSVETNLPRKASQIHENTEGAGGYIMDKDSRSFTQFQVGKDGHKTVVSFFPESNLIVEILPPKRALFKKKSPTMNVWDLKDTAHPTLNGAPIPAIKAQPWGDRLAQATKTFRSLDKIKDLSNTTPSLRGKLTTLQAGTDAEWTNIQAAQRAAGSR